MRVIVIEVASGDGCPPVGIGVDEDPIVIEPPFQFFIGEGSVVVKLVGWIGIPVVDGFSGGVSRGGRVGRSGSGAWSETGGAKEYQACCQQEADRK